MLKRVAEGVCYGLLTYAVVASLFWRFVDPGLTETQIFMKLIGI